MRFVFQRLQEPSTFAGLAAVLASIGLMGMSETEWNQVFGAVAALAGVMAMFVGEKQN